MHNQSNEWEPSSALSKPHDRAPQLETPVLLLIFNRPDTTRAVMKSLRAARPASLYVAADGPRMDHPNDIDRCETARKVATSVDWDCDVKTLYRNENLGCGLGVSSAISWFFESVDQGIVLEDDCVPSRSFYRFCRELLEYHRDDQTIMHIGGANFQYGRRRGGDSYYFSRYVNVWGWATWRRAWTHYDFTLRPSWQLQDTWDTQWQLSVEKAGGLALVSNVNLVRNVGFGPEATHTRAGERASTLVAQEISFPLSHPKQIRVDRAADLFTYYALHRQVHYPQLIPLYQIMDWALPKLKAVKRGIYGIVTRSGSYPHADDGPGANAVWPLGLRHRTKAHLKAIRVPLLRQLIHGFFAFRRRRTELTRYRRWVERGRVDPPPPLHKQMLVRETGREFGTRVLIETGTFEGQMVEAVARDFQRTITIELDPSLSARAQELFRGDPRITVVRGDTRRALPAVLENLREPALFWLDAHFSGGETAGDPEASPVMDELKVISRHALHAEHVILIDDARMFIGTAYPTLEAVRSWARTNGYDGFQVQHDIIKIYRAR